MLALGALLALFIGVLLGMLGGGGAILTLPMLVYVLHVDPRSAIATSLVVVGVTALVSMLLHARGGVVCWRVGALFGAAAMAGAFAGGRLAHFVPANVLLVLFGAMMVVAAVAMLRRRGEATQDKRELRLDRALALGGGVGLLSGLVGAGGGFLIVPALVFFGGLPMREAIATSLLVIALQSFAGFAGHAAHAALAPVLVATITSFTVAGSVAGALLGKHASPDGLRRGFAWLVVVMGIFMLVKQIPVFSAPAEKEAVRSALLGVAPAGELRRHLDHHLLLHPHAVGHALVDAALAGEVVAAAPEIAGQPLVAHLEIGSEAADQAADPEGALFAAGRDVEREHPVQDALHAALPHLEVEPLAEGLAAERAILRVAVAADVDAAAELHVVAEDAAVVDARDERVALGRGQHEPGVAPVRRSVGRLR